MQVESVSFLFLDSIEGGRTEQFIEEALRSALRRTVCGVPMEGRISGPCRPRREPWGQASSSSSLFVAFALAPRLMERLSTRRPEGHLGVLGTNALQQSRRLNEGAVAQIGGFKLARNGGSPFFTQ
jgi:hypothetical protein